VAHAIVEEIEAGDWPIGELLPSLASLANQRSVSTSTVQRAVKLLESWAYVQVVTGRGARVLP
jgi:GntR family trehalose operon transcriptional repressor